LEKQQEVVMSLSDLFMETFAMESTLLRSSLMNIICSWMTNIYSTGNNGYVVFPLFF
jgi:hypothetical protein